jgi:hypothetical protein
MADLGDEPLPTLALLDERLFPLALLDERRPLLALLDERRPLLELDFDLDDFDLALWLAISPPIAL